MEKKMELTLLFRVYGLGIRVGAQGDLASWLKMGINGLTI